MTAAPRPSSARRFVVLVLVAASLFPQAVQAQSGEAQLGESSLLASAPAAGTSASSITVGLQVNDGRTETRGYSLDATWAHMSMSETLIRFDGTLKRAGYRPAESEDRITVDDTQSLSASLVRPLSSSFALLGEASWKRDAPVMLDHRILLQAGLGINLTRGETLRMTLGPTVGIGRQNNASAAEAGGFAMAGAMQSLSWRASPTFGLETTLHGYQNLDDSDDFVLDFTVAGTSRVASRLGLKVSYSWLKEGIHPADVSSLQRRLEVGATITLAGS